MQYLLRTLSRFPKNCVFEITDACNLRCLHCEGNSGRKNRRELSTDEALSLCDELIELGTKTVHLSGGEPLLRKDWSLLATRLKSQGSAVHLITNGLLFDEQTAKTCKDIGIDIVAFSVDGDMPVHDAVRRYPAKQKGVSPFRRVFEALAMSRAFGLRTMVITHINGWNIDRLAALHELLCLVPIDAWQLQLGVPSGRMKRAPEGFKLTPSHLPRIADFIMHRQKAPFRIVTMDNIGYFTAKESSLRPYDNEHFPFFTGCLAGIQSVSIESDGTVKGCPCMGGDMAEGNIRTRSLREIWEDENAFVYNRKWNVKKLRGFCRNCEFRHICRGGCTAFAKHSSGSIYQNDFCLYRLSQIDGFALEKSNPTR